MPFGGVLELWLSCPKSQHNGVVKPLRCTGTKYPFLPSFSVFSEPLFYILVNYDFSCVLSLETLEFEILHQWCTQKHLNLNSVSNSDTPDPLLINNIFAQGCIVCWSAQSCTSFMQVAVVCSHPSQFASYLSATYLCSLFVFCRVQTLHSSHT